MILLLFLFHLQLEELRQRLQSSEQQVTLLHQSNKTLQEQLQQLKDSQVVTLDLTDVKDNNANEDSKKCKQLEVSPEISLCLQSITFEFVTISSYIVQ